MLCYDMATEDWKHKSTAPNSRLSEVKMKLTERLALSIHRMQG